MVREEGENYWKQSAILPYNSLTIWSYISLIICHYKVFCYGHLVTENMLT